MDINSYKVWKNSFERDVIVFESKVQELNSLQEQVLKIDNDIKNLKIIQSFLNKIINSKQIEVMEKVINIVSFGLQSILEDSDVKLNINEKMRKNQKFYEFSIFQDGIEVPLNAVGGGLINLISFLLRVTLLCVSQNRRTLILDEVFSNLSVNYRERIGDFLKLLVQKTGCQLFIVSHQQEIDSCADKLYELKKINNKVVLYTK